MRRIVAIVVLVGTIVGGGALRASAVVQSWDGRATGPGALLADPSCTLHGRYVVSAARYQRTGVPDATLSISACLTSSEGGSQYWNGTFTILTNAGDHIDGTANMYDGRGRGGTLTVTGGTGDYVSATGRLFASGGIVNGTADLVLTGSIDAHPVGGTRRSWTGHVHGAARFGPGSNCAIFYQRMDSARYVRPGAPTAHLSAAGCLVSGGQLAWGGSFTITTGRGATITGTFFGAIGAFATVTPFTAQFTATGGTGEYAHATGRLDATGQFTGGQPDPSRLVVDLDMAGSIVL